MSGQESNFIWRCAKCSCHFVNVIKNDGLVKLEKKCPKCKSVNTISLSNKEVNINCRYVADEGASNSHNEDLSEEY